MNTICPHCGAKHGEHHNVFDATAPQEGDYTICINCLQPAKFDFSVPGKLALLTNKDHDKLAGMVNQDRDEELARKLVELKKKHER